MLLRPWDSPGKSTGVGCHFLLQRIFPTQGSNPGLPHCRQTLYCLSHQGSLEAGKVVRYSHLIKNFPQFVVIHTVKGFSIVSEAKVDVFLELSCLFDDPTNVGNLISGSSAFSKSSLNIWKLLVHIPLKPCLENFEHCFASVWEECNCVVVWTFFGTAFLWLT